MNDRKAHRPRVRAMSEKQKIKRRKEVQSAYYHRHKKLSPRFLNIVAEHKYFSTTGKKVCKTCGDPKLPEEFYTDNKAADKLTRDCKECRLDRSLSNYYKRKGI